jgi:hypothetical protein
MPVGRLCAEHVGIVKVIGNDDVLLGRIRWGELQDRPWRGTACVQGSAYNQGCYRGSEAHGFQCLYMNVTVAVIASADSQ